MNKVLSEVYFNQTLIWLVIGKLAGDDLEWMYIAFAAVTLFRSLAAAMNEFLDHSRQQ